MEFVSVFVAILTSAFLIAGLGYFARKNGYISEAGAQGVSYWTLNFFLPVFVFLAMGQAKLSWQVFPSIAGAAWLVAGVQLILGWGFMRWADPVTRGGFLLVVGGVNCGNFGLPMNEIAFGNDATVYAMIYYVAWTTLFQPVAGYIAERSSDETNSVRESLLKVAKMPLPYAAIVGILWNYAGLNPVWTTMIGKGLFKGLGSIALVAPFTMLFVLGTGLYRAGNATGGKISETLHSVPFELAIAMRLFVAPFIALAITQVLQMDWKIAQVVILSSSAPVAVQALMISESARVPGLANFVRKEIVWTTLVSTISVPFLITLIR